MMRSVALFVFLPLCLATVYFQEEFDESWKDRWTVSKWRSDQAGKWSLTAGKWYGEETRDKGIQTSEDYRFYAISTKFPEVTNSGGDLILSFTLKFEQDIDCGGGYIKLLAYDFDQSTFGGDTPYGIMFGPDICGETKKTHLIFNYKGKNLDRKNNIRVESDQLTHLYTLHLKADRSYEVFIDRTSAAKGTLESDWDFLPAKTIKDPSAKKPSDWVDDAKIPDPNDVKPEGWDSIPQYIADPSATKPEDWDANDGEWEAPLIENPEFKGEWKPKKIDNPNYKGPWIHPTIANPDYVEDSNLHVYKIGGIGIEIWQVKSGTLYDNIFVGSSIEEHNAFVDRTWAAMKDGEKQMKEKIDEAEAENMQSPGEEDDQGFDEEDLEDNEEGYDLKDDL